MTEIEIRDPDEPEPSSASPVGAPDTESEDDGAGGPYRNLLVPLVVVPALIVMVLLLVFTLFGAIAGKEASPQENIERLLSGGANEREQAAFLLVRQVVAEWEGREEGEWRIDESLLPRLRAAFEENRDIEREGDVPIPMALAIVMGHIGDLQGVYHLAEMTQLDAALDPEGVYRMYAGFALGTLGERVDEAGQAAAAAALIALLGDEDPVLRTVGAAGLQTIQRPESLEALKGVLDEASLDLRGTAALSLAELGDETGVSVLEELLDPRAYERDRAADTDRWTSQQNVGVARRKALEALVELGRGPERAELERLADDDPDPGVREAARLVLSRS